MSVTVSLESGLKPPHCGLPPDAPGCALASVPSCARAASICCASRAYKGHCAPSNELIFLSPGAQSPPPRNQLQHIRVSALCDNNWVLCATDVRRCAMRSPSGVSKFASIDIRRHCGYIAAMSYRCVRFVTL